MSPSENIGLQLSETLVITCMQDYCEVKSYSSLSCCFVYITSNPELELGFEDITVISKHVNANFAMIPSPVNLS